MLVFPYYFINLVISTMALINYTAGGVQPAFKFLFNVIKRYTMCYISSGIYLFLLHACYYMFKVLPLQCGCSSIFSFMKLRMTKRDINQSKHTLSDATCIESIIDGFQTSCCINRDGRISPLVISSTSS